MSELEISGGGLERTKRSRLRAVVGFLLIVVSVAVLFLTVNLGKIALSAPGIALVFRGLMLSVAAALFAIWIWVAWTLVKRKVTTGRFTPGLEATRLRREEQLKRLGAGKPLRPQLGYWLLPLGVSAWLLTAAGAIVWKKAAWCDCEPPAVWMVWGLAAALAALGLIYPAMCVWRKATTGYFLASNERIRARLSRVGTPPKKWQPMALAILWTLMAILETVLTLRRGHARATGWFVVAAFWFAAASWFLSLMLRQKSTHPSGSEPDGSDEPPPAGEGATHELRSRA
jgi:hypothetical protein